MTDATRLEITEIVRTEIRAALAEFFPNRAARVAGTSSMEQTEPSAAPLVSAAESARLEKMVLARISSNPTKPRPKRR